jgi:tetratricopeptide (TPR) repeat protein
MIARMIVASNPGPWISPGAGAPVVGISPGAVVIAGVGDGAAIPIVGISPAIAETERMHVRATANMKRFMGVAPYLRSNHVNLCTSPKIRPIPQHFLQGRPQRTNIAFALVLLHFLKASTHMRTTSPKLDTAHLSASAEALLRCQTALDLRDRSEYDAAREVMAPIWNGVIGSRPNTEGLHDTVVPEVLLTTGILTGWLGSRNEIKDADDYARDLITESITLFEALGDSKKVAEARTELAVCYWRAGANDEARIWFTTALERLKTEGNTRANALLGLSVVEWSASRHDESWRILTTNAPLFRKITNQSLKGFYHNQSAMTLRALATERKRDDYFQRAIKHYEEADYHFTLARNTVYRAHVKNNVGYLFFKLARFRKAHEYLDHARRLLVSVRDKVRVAQVDDTRAQVFIAEGRYQQAEAIARNAVSSFRKAGRQCFLAEALVTHGIALARLTKTVRAQSTLQEAVEIAHCVGALNQAGIAALTLIEEIESLPLDLLLSAYDKASEWLAEVQSAGLLARLNKAARKVIARLQSEKVPESADVLFKGLYFPDEVLRFERGLIRVALAEVNGSVTHAAALLGISHQRLARIIEKRHPELLKERTPVRRRPRKTGKRRK